MSQTPRRPIRLVLLGLVVVLLGFPYVQGAMRQATLVNTTLENTDQGAYLEYAVNLKEVGSRFVGDRNQMPGYPFLQSLWYDRQANADEAFLRAKKFNIALSLVLLGVLFLLWRKQFPPLQTAALLLVTGFLVFVFRAGYLQVELLYYVAFFIGFLLMVRLLAKPSWALAAFTGLWLGVAHLTKASILPGLLLFAAIFALQGLGLLIRGWRQRGREPFTPQPALRQAGQLLLLIGVFLATVSPYLMTSKKVFGQALYNVNSTFYMWYDDWGQARTGTIAHGDRDGWPAMPPEELPSASKYLKEHSLGNIVARLKSGVRVLGWVVQTYGYWKYVLFYGGCALLILGLNWRWGVGLIRQHPFVALFGLGFMAGYVLLFAWYIPIARGNRLVLALFLPFMFSAGWILRARAALERGEGDPPRWPAWYRAIHIVMIVGVALELHGILTDRLVTMYAGD